MDGQEPRDFSARGSGGTGMRSVEPLNRLDWPRTFANIAAIFIMKDLLKRPRTS
jgi:hypothetical protein